MSVASRCVSGRIQVDTASLCSNCSLGQSFAMAAHMSLLNVALLLTKVSELSAYATRRKLPIRYFQGWHPTVHCK